jgi:hypothetical protein
MQLKAMAHMCCTTQSQPLWSMALTAIISERYMRTSSRDYCNKVWWPILDHLVSLNQKTIDFQTGNLSDLFILFQKVRIEFKRLSPSMKHCWLDFLLRSKIYITEPRSNREMESHSNRVVDTYLLCCMASMGSTTADRCMLEFMEVLTDRCLELEERHFERIGLWLFAGEYMGLGRHVLYQGNLSSGSSFYDVFESAHEYLQQPPSLSNTRQTFVMHCPPTMHPTRLAVGGGNDSLTF